MLRTTPGDRARCAALRIAALVFLLPAAVVSGGCANRLFYMPTRTVYRMPADVGTPCEQVQFASADGTRLCGWFLPAHGPAKGTIVHFHGNAQNMTAHVSFVDWLPSHGFNVFVFDYRGYGCSDGRPTRNGTFQDGLAAVRYVFSRPDVDRRRVALLGQSLGGALAIAVAASGETPSLRAVVSESAFCSYRGIARDKIGGLSGLRHVRGPLSWLVASNGHSPGNVVSKLAPVPLLLIHGTADPVVPYHNAVDLLALAREPKQLWTVEGGRHTEALGRPELGYRAKLVAYLAGILADD